MSMRGVTGFPLPMDKPLYRYDSERAFNGDGYSILVLELTPKMARYFQTPPPSFFQKYPALSNYEGGGGGWQLTRWRNGPVRAEEQHLVDFALSSALREEPPAMRETFQAARRSLGKPSSLYAYYWRYPERLGDVHFFLIDPEDRRIYIFQQNT